MTYILLIIANINAYTNFQAMEFKTEKRCKEAIVDIVQLYKNKNTSSPPMICLKK